MNKEMENVLLELLSFFAASSEQKIAVLEQISEEQNLPFETITGRLVERLREYCAYYLIDPDISSADKSVEKLSELLELMLQSDDPKLWMRAAVSKNSSWFAVTGLAGQANLRAGKGLKRQLSAKSLSFQIEN